MAEQKTIEELTREWQIVADKFKESISSDAERLLRIVADALTIKMNNIMPWYYTQKQGATNATEEHVYSHKVRPGQIVVLTHVSATNQNSIKVVQIAVERGGEEIVLNKDKPSATGYMINFDGQVLMSEGDRVKCTFYGASVTDVCAVSCSGYEIKA